MGGGGADSKTSGALPWWVQGAHKTLIDKAENFAYGDLGKYEEYGGQEIAGLTPQELQANEARQEIFNRGDVAGQFAAEQLGKSAGLTDQVWDVANSEFGADDYESRKNPYFDAVTSMNLREADQSFDRRINQDQASSTARGGSIGSYRVGLENAFLEGERGQVLGDIRNQGELDNWNQAQTSFYGDRDSKLAGLGQGASAYNELGAQASALGTQSLAREQSMTNELGRSGSIEREMLQRELDLGKRNWQNEQDYPKQQMNWMSSMLSGVPNAQLGTTTTTSAQPGLVSQLAGYGLAASSISQMLSGN
jgi:hypothetical protein